MEIKKQNGQNRVFIVLQIRFGRKFVKKESKESMCSVTNSYATY